VWTRNARRLAILVGQALKFDEPVLLVGETGCGKTTIIQLFSRMHGRQLHAVNCHMHSEAADFIGGLRPYRGRGSGAEPSQSAEVDVESNMENDAGKLFEWNDGPLVRAMRNGDFFLADEISLADDSVLERLNSLLETERTIFLAEKAAEGFWFASTMNPGGDFGKKELSPALRNRFTEIWCPSALQNDDLFRVITHNLVECDAIDREAKRWIANGMVEFMRWFEKEDLGKRTVISLRDILSWVNFVNVYASRLNAETAFVHGASMVFLDSLGTGSTSSEQADSVKAARAKALRMLISSLPDTEQCLPEDQCLTVRVTKKHLSVGPYKLSKDAGAPADSVEFDFSAPTTCGNAMRLLRAMGLRNPLLLEGPPGVGKTSIVTALAKQCGKQVTRINLSEQTDIADLFGADLPVEGGVGGRFQWRDGPLLRALKRGDWVLLDELNLASQSVLEGLNACLDHRGEIFVPELNRTFAVEKKRTRIFGCQNPHRQGGGRKGLPKSFLNRFTQVYMEPLTDEDLYLILRLIAPSVNSDQLKSMVKFNSIICDEVQIQGLWGHHGSPWELNLRDMYRWAQMVIRYDMRPSELVSFMYADRMRTQADRCRVADICRRVFGEEMARPFPKLRIAPEWLQIGNFQLPRSTDGGFEPLSADVAQLRLLRGQRRTLESIASCLDQATMCLLVGSAGCGKTSAVKSLCALVGRRITVLPVTSEMDIIELLGGFEQVDLNRALSEIIDRAIEQARSTLITLLKEGDLAEAEKLLKRMQTLAQENSDFQQSVNGVSKSDNVIDTFLQRITLVRTFVAEVSLPCMLPRLLQLETLATEHGSLTCGGRFTWVDSALIRALQNGDWLLIENVNFCAASVLDRLNGLLEQNGVLTVTEAGVKDGELRTIVPHPDFRLILTMDPKHGEISRAMRNRGHEVYMFPLDETVDEWDLVALLEAKGCLSEELAHKCWTIVDELRKLGMVSGVINQVIRAVEAMEQESTWGAPAVPTLVKFLIRYVKTLATDLDVETLVLSSLVDVHDKPTARQKTASLANFLYGGNMAEHFEDAIVFTQNETELRAENMRQVRAGHLHQIYVESMSLSDVPGRLSFIEVKAVVDVMTSLCSDFYHRIDGYDKHLCIDHRLNACLSKRLQLRNPWANTFAFALMADVLYAQLPVKHDDDEVCDTYLSVSVRNKDTLPHALIGMLPALIDTLESYVTDKKSMTLSDEQLVAGKRILYGVYRFKQRANQPVRFVERDVRMMAVALLWALKRVLSSPTDSHAEQVRQLLRQLERLVPDLFSRARKLREATVCAVGMPVVMKAQDQAELYRRALSVEPLAENVAQRVVMELADEDEAVVACAVGELDKMAKPMKERAKKIMDDVVHLASAQGEQEIGEMEERLAGFAEGLQRFDTNYVLVAPYEHEQEMQKHLQPAQAVLDVRKAMAALDAAQPDFIVNFVDLAVRSWSCVARIDEYLQWTPPHIISTLTATSKCVPRPSAGNERKLHSSALVFNHPAIVHCLGPLVDAELNKANLHLDYSQMKLKELDEIRRLLWEYVSIRTDIDSQNRAVMHTIMSTVRPILEKNHAALTEGMARALSACTTTERERQKDPSSAQFSPCVQQVRAAHLLLQIFTPFDTMDPYEKVAMKKEYLTEERAILLDELTVRRWLQLRRTACQTLNEHPSYSRNGEICEAIKGKLENLEKRMAYRPEKSQYAELAQIMQQYVQRNATAEIVDRMLSGILNNEDMETTLDTWLTNQKSFILHMRRAHPFYRDLVYPFLFGASQLVNSLETLYKFVRNNSIRLTIGEIVRFPRLIGPSLAPNISAAISAATGIKGDAQDNLRTIWSLKLRESKAELLEILDALRMSSAGRAGLIDKVDRIVSLLGTQYVEYVETEAERELTKNSLYEMRTKEFLGEENDEALEARAIASMFPNFDEVYEDITDERDFLSQDKRPEVSTQQRPEGLSFVKFTDEDLLLVHRIVSEIASVAESSDRRGPGDVVSCLLERFRLFQQLRPNIMDRLSIEVDDQALAAHLIASINTSWMITGDETKLHMHARVASRVGQRVDFYRDANVVEVVKCQPVLHKIIERCKELLASFENHHGLVQVLKVSYRVLSLPITSPLMKVLAGLLRVLTEIEEWNKNVPRNMKMAREMAKLAHLITSWRKLELVSWSGLLDSALEARKVDAAKFWFRLERAISERHEAPQASEHSGDDHLTEVVEATVTLMESTSILGDFGSKLEMISQLALYVKVRGRPGDEELSSVLSNVHKYYGQFLPTMEEKIQATRKEIDNDIKDYIKIVRYKDTSYLAIKQSAEKSHKKLHRCLRDFEKVIREPASGYLRQQTDTLAAPSSRSRNKKKKKRIVELPKVEIINYFVKAIDLRVPISKEDAYSDIPLYHRLARRYLRGVAESSQVQRIADILDELASDVAEGVNKLAKETDKQIRHDDKHAKRKAKNLLQRKKKSLVELFRQLTKCGLSYRKGVLHYRRVKAIDLIATPMLELTALPDEVRSFAEDANAYFFKSVQKYRDLQTAMAAPSKELELNVVERLQGFGSHLFDQVVSASRELAEVGREARELRSNLAQMKAVAACERIPEQSHNKVRRTEMHQLLAKLCSCLQQFLVLMETLPAEEMEGSVKVVQTRRLAEKTKATLVENINVMNERIRVFDAMDHALISQQEAGVLDETEILLRDIPVKLSFVVDNLEAGRPNYITAPYHEFLTEVSQTLQAIRQRPPEQCDEEAVIRSLEQSKAKCIKKVLHSVQTISKAYEQAPALDKQDNTTNILHMLVDERRNLLDNFDLSGVSKSLASFQQKLVKLSVEVPAANLASFVAFMENFSSNFDYALVCAVKAQRAKLKLLYIVLSVSVDLVRRGFCIPEEFRDDLMKEGGVQLQDIEDGGLGDGEGQKDTSDKIDCEDQLEDAQQKGQEPEEQKDDDEKDIDDEENGIEMSEDFDAKAQGPNEQKAEEQDKHSGDEESNQDDLDDQMGDVEDNDPFDLDKEMWDKQQGEDDQDLNSDDDAQGGEELEEESQMVAKDGRARETEKEAKSEKDKPQDDDNEEDKVNEMDDEYEGEKEDPYKSGKEKGLDEDNEIEDFDLPDNPIEVEVGEDEEEENGEDNDIASDKEEGGAEGSEDAEASVDEDLPDLPDDGEEPMDEGEVANAEGEQPVVETPEDNVAERGEANMDDTALDRTDENKPQAEQAAGDKSATQAAEESSDRRGECMQTSDDIKGSGEGHTSSVDTGGAGRTTDRAREKSVQADGQSYDKEKKSSMDRKMAPLMPRDRELVNGDISEAVQREKQYAKEKGTEFEHQHEHESDADNEEVAADMATDEQAEKAQPMAANEEQPKREEDDSGMEDVAPECSSEPMEIEEQDAKDKLKAMTHEQQQQTKDKKKASKMPKGEQGQDGEAQPKDGDRIDTHTVQRGNQAVIEARPDLLEEKAESIKLKVEPVPRIEISGNLTECRRVWAEAENGVATLVQELCEQLRLVLEPTKTSKLKGDYRTGKRLNMRKVIDYVASGFRKDKIWMKRTKPNKRQYQIMLAVDDSASMSDSKAKEMTFETVALLANALSSLEAGELSVASFGRDVSLVHPLGEPWSIDSGANLVKNFTFAQDETKVSKLVSFATDVFEQSRSSITGNLVRRETAQLLIIISDGRLMSEGSDVVKGTIQRARENGVFIVYLLLDNPTTSQGSVMEMQSASFDAATNKPVIHRYMSSFPFPFYAVLRELDSMPVILGEALRQWFELVTGK
ncbi:midasin-like, partial [Tropilaelaps mercedesae]